MPSDPTGNGRISASLVIGYMGVDQQPLRASPLRTRFKSTGGESFNDPILTGLIRRAAGENLDVGAATERLAESRAQRGIAAADQFPTLNGNASYTRQQQSDNGVASLLQASQPPSTGASTGGLPGGSQGGVVNGSPGTANNGLGQRLGGIPSRLPPYDLWQYGFDASWEADIWGRVRRSVENADASVEASAEDRRNTLLSTLAEVARDYIQLRGTQAQLGVTRDNLKTAEDSLLVTRSRATSGLTNDLDVQNAAGQVESNAASLPQLEQQEEQGMNALALLLGEAPGALRAELAEPRPVPPVPAHVPIGLPSELARRRPDVRQAEAQLHAATAEIGVAEADFFPRITLSGSLSLQSLQFKDLGSWASRSYGVGPSITLPIFQGGQLRATLTLRRRQAREAAITYRKTVLQAFHDVDNALIAYNAEQRRHDRLARDVKANQAALVIARSRYRSGLSTFLDVLTAERSLLSAQQQLADSTATIGTNLVQLYKALGGGWEDQYPREQAFAETGLVP